VKARPAHVAAATAALIALGAAPALADITATSTTGTTTSTEFSSTAPADRPAPVLSRKMHGRSAVDALGSRLPAVAARNDLSASRLKKIMVEDPTAWLSEEGKLFYREQMPGLEDASSEQATGSGSGSTTTMAFPTSQTFTLHSRPSATRQIFLDFNGAEIAGTGWNTGSSPLPAATYTGYDSDGNVTAYSAAEHAWMQEVWRQVSEAYAPFDVDVTTEDEGASARTRTTTADSTFGTQVLFTNSAQAVASACNSACLGIAYVGTFGDVDPVGYYQPAWVFTSNSMSATIAAQGAEHEAGHTLGLHHDGTTTSPYYAGTAAWGPIMGSARTRAVSQFSLGEYAGANNTEDDFSVIQGNNLPLRSDDHGNTVGTTDQLGTQTSYAVNGVISTRLDTDVFAVNLNCSTDMTVTATGIGPQTTLDLKLDVLNGSGATVTSSAPPSAYTTGSVSTGMNATATVPGAIGTYYLRVDGVGSGDPHGTGWSDYGSLGQYKLTANGCGSTTTQPPTPPTQPGAQTHTVTRPGPPRIGTASTGAKRGQVTAVARWSPPTNTGGSPITRYRVVAKRLDAHGRVIRSYSSGDQRVSVRKVSLKLPKARYRFVVVAWNRVGASKYSAMSNVVTAR
jgi:hypothetical protein